MELIHDWKTLNKVLFEGEVDFVPEARKVMILTVKENRLVDILSSSGEKIDVNPLFTQDTVSNLKARFPDYQVILIQWERLQQILLESLQKGSNFFEQLQHLRTQLLEGPSEQEKNFVLDLFRGRWAALLPNKFLVFFLIDQSDSTQVKQDYLLCQFENRELVQFFKPDFSDLHEDRLKSWRNEYKAIDLYLRNRYMLPCYGVYIDYDQWALCQKTQILETSRQRTMKAWGRFSELYAKNLARITPDYWYLRFVLALMRWVKPRDEIK